VAAAITDITPIFRDILHDPDLDLASTTRFDDLAGWDSMDLITVVFDLQFELPEIDRLTNIGDLVRMIEAKQALAAA